MIGKVNEEIKMLGVQLNAVKDMSASKVQQIIN